MRQIFHALPWIPPKEPREVAELFSQYGVPLTYKSGQLLKSRGENNKLFLITKGAAAYYIADRYKSHPSVLNLLIPGRSACDLSALTETKVNVTTRAIGPCEVLAMHPHLISKFMLEHSEFSLDYAKHVVFKQECSIEAMVANFTLEPAERLRRLLKVLLISYEKPIPPNSWIRIPLDLTNEQYGSVVNLTRVSVSRLFSDWTSKGLLKKSGRTVYVMSSLFDNMYDWGK